MSMIDVIREHIEIVEGASGPKARIAGRRVRVQDVAVLAYYWDHREEIEAQIVEEQTFVEQLRRAQGPGPLARKIRRLLDE